MMCRCFSGVPRSRARIPYVLSWFFWSGITHAILDVSQPSTRTLVRVPRWIVARFGHGVLDATAALALVMESGNQRFDEGRLAQNVMLAAWAHRVGSCIGSMYPEPNTKRAKELLSVPPSRWLHTVISLGYPADQRALRLSADRGTLTEMPVGRKDLATLVSWERFGAGPA